MKYVDVIIYIEYLLLNNKKVNYQAIKDKLDISRSTYTKAIRYIDCALADLFDSNFNLIFDFKSKSYILNL